MLIDGYKRESQLAAWRSGLARKAHNLEVTGSIPVVARFVFLHSFFPLQIPFPITGKLVPLTQSNSLFAQYIFYTEELFAQIGT